MVPVPLRRVAPDTHLAPAASGLHADLLEPYWQDLLDTGEELMAACLANFREIDGVLLVVTDSATADVVTVVGPHPDSPVDIATLVDLLENRADRDADSVPVAALYSRTDVVAGARLLALASGVTVMRVEMFGDSASAPPAA